MVGNRSVVRSWPRYINVSRQTVAKTVVFVPWIALGVACGRFYGWNAESPLVVLNPYPRFLELCGWFVLALGTGIIVISRRPGLLQTRASLAAVLFSGVGILVLTI